MFLQRVYQITLGDKELECTFLKAGQLGIHQGNEKDDRNPGAFVHSRVRFAPPPKKKTLEALSKRHLFLALLEGGLFLLTSLWLLKLEQQMRLE